MIRKQPLTVEFKGDRYSFYRYKESRDTTNIGVKDKAAMQALIVKGKIAAETFDDAVSAGNRAFYEAITADVLEAEAAFKELEQGTDARFGRAAPSLRNVRKALEDCRQILEPLLAQKRLKEPDPEPVPEPIAEGDPAAALADGQAVNDAGVPAPAGSGRLPAVLGLGTDVARPRPPPDRVPRPRHPARRGRMPGSRRTARSTPSWSSRSSSSTRNTRRSRGWSAATGIISTSWPGSSGPGHRPERRLSGAGKNRDQFSFAICADNHQSQNCDGANARPRRPGNARSS